MARKTLADLKPKVDKHPENDDERWAKIILPTREPTGVQSRHDKSWVALGWDTSMTSVACVGTGYDAILRKHVGPAYGDIRWMPEDDYFPRLGAAAKSHDVALHVLGDLGIPLPYARVFMAFEEPVPYGMIKKAGMSGWIKQQCEVAGAVKGSLFRYGFVNLSEINNSQWRKVLRNEGVTLPKGSDAKWEVKKWAIKAFGLPDLPDLVKAKSGAKIPRPETGFGSKAKPIQPNDVYDAAAVCAWQCDNLPE